MCFVFYLIFIFLNALLNLIPFYIKTEQILCFGKKSVHVPPSTLAFCRYGFYFPDLIKQSVEQVK